MDAPWLSHAAVAKGWRAAAPSLSAAIDVYAQTQLAQQTGVFLVVYVLVGSGD